MDKINKVSKIFLFLFVVSGAIWLGSYITRLTLFYQIFQPTEFVLEEFVTDQNLGAIFQTLIAAVSINLVFYLLMTISFAFFIFTSKLSLKLNGWLFISVILILFSLPFELYLMIVDYNLLMIVFSSNFDSNKALELVIKRFTILSGFPVVEILSYFAVIYLFLFQPLKDKSKKLVE